MGYTRTGSRVVPRRKQLGKQEMRGPPSGRAQEQGRRQPRDEVNGSRPHWRKAFTFYLQGIGSSNFKNAFNGPSQKEIHASI